MDPNNRMDRFHLELPSYCLHTLWEM